MEKRKSFDQRKEVIVSLCSCFVETTYMCMCLCGCVCVCYNWRVCCFFQRLMKSGLVPVLLSEWASLSLSSVSLSLSLITKHGASEKQVALRANVYKTRCDCVWIHAGVCVCVCVRAYSSISNQLLSVTSKTDHIDACQSHRLVPTLCGFSFW